MSTNTFREGLLGVVNLTFSPTATRAGTDASETCPADHTGVVAGVLSGVLGAALIGLLIALICALKNRKALQRDLVSTQSQRDTAYEQNTNEKAQLQKQLEQLEQQQLQQQNFSSSDSTKINMRLCSLVRHTRHLLNSTPTILANTTRLLLPRQRSTGHGRRKWRPTEDIANCRTRPSRYLCNPSKGVTACGRCFEDDEHDLGSRALIGTLVWRLDPWRVVQVQHWSFCEFNQSVLACSYWS